MLLSASDFQRGNLRRSQFLDAQLREPLAEVDALFKGLALHNSGDETTGKSITRARIVRYVQRSQLEYLPSTVGVVNGVLRNFVHRELLDFDFTAGGNGSGDGGQSALGHNGNSRAVGVLLGQLSQLLRNLDNVGGAPFVALGVSNSLCLVAERVVGVGEDTVKLVLEELGNEGSGERKHKDLISQA